jgi:hypothetical protein
MESIHAPNTYYQPSFIDDYASIVCGPESGFWVFKKYL